MEWRLFANLAETAGTKRVEVDAGPGDTFRDAFEQLLETHPELREEVLQLLVVLVGVSVVSHERDHGARADKRERREARRPSAGDGTSGTVGRRWNERRSSASDENQSISRLRSRPVRCG